MEADYRAELCRITSIKIKNYDDLTVLFFDFHIIGRSQCKYNLKFENPTKELIDKVCSICSIFYFDTDLEFYAKENDAYIFFVIFEFNDIYQGLVAFSPTYALNLKFEWEIVKVDDFYDLPIDMISSDLKKSYDIYINLMLKQTLEKIDINLLNSYLKYKISNFDLLNASNEITDFVIEAFLNSSLICSSVHSQLLISSQKYVILRNKRITKSTLAQAFKIEELNGKCRLVSSLDILHSMNSF